MHINKYMYAHMYLKHVCSHAWFWIFCGRKPNPSYSLTLFLNVMLVDVQGFKVRMWFYQLQKWPEYRDNSRVWVWDILWSMYLKLNFQIYPVIRECQWPSV